MCCGKESLHIELCVRTVCELVLNEEYYLQPCITSLLDAGSVGKNALIASFEAAAAMPDTDIARTTLRLDCIATTKLGEWSNIFHLYGLASVLKKSIISVYPDVNTRIRERFNREILPRITDLVQHSIPLIILWTNLSHIPNKNKPCAWSPNHFVPCFSSSKSISIEGQSLQAKTSFTSSPSPLLIITEGVYHPSLTPREDILH